MARQFDSAESPAKSLLTGSRPCDVHRVLKEVQDKILACSLRLEEQEARSGKAETSSEEAELDILSWREVEYLQSAVMNMQKHLLHAQHLQQQLEAECLTFQKQLSLEGGPMALKASTLVARPKPAAVQAVTKQVLENRTRIVLGQVAQPEGSEGRKQQPGIPRSPSPPVQSAPPRGRSPSPLVTTHIMSQTPQPPHPPPLYALQGAKPYMASTPVISPVLASRSVHYGSYMGSGTHIRSLSNPPTRYSGEYAVTTNSAGFPGAGPMVMHRPHGASPSSSGMRLSLSKPAQEHVPIEPVAQPRWTYQQARVVTRSLPPARSPTQPAHSPAQLPRQVILPVQTAIYTQPAARGFVMPVTPTTAYRQLPVHAGQPLFAKGLVPLAASQGFPLERSVLPPTVTSQVMKATVPSIQSPREGPGGVSSVAASHGTVSLQETEQIRRSLGFPR